jgi:GGDEF domain-containing protein
MWDEPKDQYNNGISIGLIGPDEAINQLLRTLQRFPSFKPIAKSYRLEEDAPALALDLMDHVEVLLFTGPIPYRITKDKLQFTIPVHYVPLTGTCLYRALFLIEKRYGLKALSVDTMSKKQVEHTFKELSELNIQVVYYNGIHPYSRDELVQFHVQNYKAGPCQAVLTGIKSVSEELTRLGIPNEWVVPTEQDMIVSLERALLSTETRRSNESQIVFGVVHLDDAGSMINRRFTEHDIQKMKLEIHKMLLGYVESLDAHLIHLGGDEYLFITTRGIFERVTGGYKYIALAGEGEKLFGVTFSIGIGFGRSAGEAGTHARLALRQAKEAGGNHCFIVREDRGLIGPLEMSQPLEYDASLIDNELIAKMETSGMTLPYLSKIVAQVAKKRKFEYTAQELSFILGVTVRSTHRFLLQWLDAGLVEIAGEEKGKAKGRPKQIYRLTFINDANIQLKK